MAQQQSGIEFLVHILHYLCTAAEHLTEDGLRQTMETTFPGAGDRIVSTIAEKWVEQGMQRGMQQGLQQGLQQGMERGMRQGLLAGIELGLKLRFRAEGLRLLPELYEIEDVGVLRAIHEGIETVSTPDELRRIYQPAGDDGEQGEE